MAKSLLAAEQNGRRDLFASCSFADLGLHPALCEHLQEKMGFQLPTKVQAESIPVVISGNHLLVKAATGTGKTVAYLAPIVHLLQKHEPSIKRSQGTFALVLVPTRELCMQVHGVAQKLVHRFHWIVPGYIMGGENRNKEKARLRKGISILIATPGRLLDHLKNTKSFSHDNLQWIVFDEADRMLELGFGKDVKEILDILGSRQEDHDLKEKDSRNLKFLRQNLLLSATLNEKVNQLANISLKNPIMIGLDENKMPPAKAVGNSVQTSMTCSTSESDDDDFVAHGSLQFHSVENFSLPEQLVQRYVKVPCGSRLVVLLSILRAIYERETVYKIVVFFSTCDSVDFHFTLFSEFLWPADLQTEVDQKQKFLRCKAFRLHGNMDQDDRRKAFQEFSSERSALLLSTDVAARGLDIPKVKCIIQYDSPGEASEYVHRVGRTARLGERGEALLFLQPMETDYLRDLERHGVSLKEYPLQKVLDGFRLRDVKYNRKKMLSMDTHPWVLFLQRALESVVSAEPKTKKLGKDAFCSWVRAYTAHRGDLKKIFMVKKLHLGHVAKSFGLKEQPSLVGSSHQAALRKRKRDKRPENSAKRHRLSQKV